MSLTATPTVADVLTARLSAEREAAWSEYLSLVTAPHAPTDAAAVGRLIDIARNLGIAAADVQLHLDAVRAVQAADVAAQTIAERAADRELMLADADAAERRCVASTLAGEHRADLHRDADAAWRDRAIARTRQADEARELRPLVAAAAAARESFPELFAPGTPSPYTPAGLAHWTSRVDELQRDERGADAGRRITIQAELGRARRLLARARRAAGLAEKTD